MKFGYVAFVLLVIPIIFVSGCTGLLDDTSKVVCSHDAKRCDDGTYVKRVPPSCEFEECGDGSIPVVVNDTGIDLKNCDPEIFGVVGPCTEEYMPVCAPNGETYSNECFACRAGWDSFVPGACACPEDARVCEDGTVVVRIPPDCEFEECPEPLEEVFCTEDDRDVDCNDEEEIVCGWFDETVNCIKYPCTLEFPNSCFACQNENIEYYTTGECPA